MWIVKELIHRVRKIAGNVWDMLDVWVRVFRDLKEISRWTVRIEILNSMVSIAASWGGYLVLGWFIDSLLNAQSAGRFTSMLTWALVVNLLVQFCRELSPVFSYYIAETLGFRLFEKLVHAGETKRSKLDAPTVENPDNRETLEQSGVPADSYIQEAPRMLFRGIESAVEVVVAIIIVSILHLWLCPLLVLVCIPLLINSYRYGRSVSNFYETQFPVLQKVYDLRSIMDDPRRSHELRVDRPRRLALLGLLALWLRHLRTEKVKLERKYLINQLIPVVLNVAALGGLIWWMCLEVVVGKLTVGDLLARWEILAAFTVALSGACENAGQLLEHNRVLSRVYELLEVRGQIYSPPGGTLLDFDSAPPSIDYIGVKKSFPGKAWALDGISASIQPGEILALTGPNGGGKSTMISMISRMYDPTAGRLLIGGHELSEVNLRSLWGHIAYTPQASNVFPFLTAAEHVATIRTEELETRALSGESIDKFATYFKGTFEEACRLACIGPSDVNSNLLGFVLSNKPLSAQYPGGMSPSGGMIQRLALARTFYRLLLPRGAAKIGIFDEPTSALDADRGKIIDNILSFKGRATILVIDHYPPNLRKFDRLIVLDSGRIVQDGPPAQLMTQDGYFRMSCEEEGLAA